MATNFKNALGTCGTAQAVAYTAPAGRGTVITSATFCNITDNSTPNVSVSVTSGGVTKHVLFKAMVPANGTLTLKPEAQIVLKPGDTLNVQASAAAAIDYVISATEL
ncbi:hypothetical protein [Bordetella phage vB_BbrM_PHB04]|uniref:Uncharacterized protein n=1 Tax=Bordetella phage vB_BbrM_PHB04 TaxID=2029657 RepID=A0A291LA17_9CAUD|nr:hypothetical protein HOS14_gp123 [Bordetella phage vB_BbrM_PHB04]ATI15741.1 hypothetical protein [Bordetella phage vB_BbrM_PHB04]